MNIEFTARHFHAPAKLRIYTENEVQKLKRYFNRIIQCQVVLSHENNQYTTEINLSIPKRKINVKDTTDNVTKSIDRAVSKMAGRISKFKERQNGI
jgi:putative sigma-54 modulation protein|tara:strand:+ start:354 stop:641 length:288 start_codon:yes stop_codon:yes gene_type:complete